MKFTFFLVTESELKSDMVNALSKINVVVRLLEQRL